MILFSPTSRGWGERRGQWGVRGLNRLLMPWEVPDVTCLSTPFQHGPQTDSPQSFPSLCLPQVDAQLTGRISQKAERGTKVEMVGGGRSHGTLSLPSMPSMPYCIRDSTPTLFPPVPFGQS